MSLLLFFMLWLLLNVEFNINTVRNWFWLGFNNHWSLYFLLRLFLWNLLRSAEQLLHHEFFHIELILLNCRRSRKDRLGLLYWPHRLSSWLIGWLLHCLWLWRLIDNWIWLDRRLYWVFKPGNSVFHDPVDQHLVVVLRMSRYFGYYLLVALLDVEAFVLHLLHSPLRVLQQFQESLYK